MSKSVRESRTDAAIGSRKKSPMTRRPGARKKSAARTSPGTRRRSTAMVTSAACEHPAPLLEDPVDVPVDRRESRWKTLPSADGGFETLGHVLRNLLPFRNPRHRHDALGLDAECAGLLVPRQRRIVPGGADGGEVSRQCIEAGLHRRVRQELDHFPRFRLAVRAPEDREARPARKGHPWPR